MAKADRLAIEGGIAGIVLMENAGRAVADAVTQRYPNGAPQVCVVAGPGNNGGDGFVAARILEGRGFPVRLLLLGERDRLKGDTAEAARRWQGRTIAASPQGLAGASIIIDALFGAGLDRPVEGQARTMIEAINGSGVPVVAVDLPSGINGATGAVIGAVVRANETVTFFRRKPRACADARPDALRGAQGRRYRIPYWRECSRAGVFNGPGLWSEHFPVPSSNAHKYARGHTVMVSGDMASIGAARLAARGALRAGSGLVTLASPADALAINAAASLAVMVRQADDAASLSAMLSDRVSTPWCWGRAAGWPEDV